MSDIFGGPPYDDDEDPMGYPEDYAELEDPYGFFHGDAPEGWWSDDVSLYNELGQEITLPANEWYEATFMGDDLTGDFYGMGVLDIIHELEDYGLWDADDWETWREQYG